MQVVSIISFILMPLFAISVKKGFGLKATSGDDTPSAGISLLRVRVRM
jgi:hypothetical protein